MQEAEREALKRFSERQNDFRPVLISSPQCTKCKNNTDGLNCAKWGTAIPNKFFKNKQECAYLEIRDGMTSPWL